MAPDGRRAAAPDYRRAPVHRWRGGLAHRLRVGDRLVCEDGTTVAVEEVLDTGAWEVVYNLRVADHHTYFVGQDEWGFAVWAHNVYIVALPHANQALASLGTEYALLAKQLLVHYVPRRSQSKTTIAVSQAMVEGRLRYIIGVYGPPAAYYAIVNNAPNITGYGEAIHSLPGQVHAERIIYDRYFGEPGFTNAIGHSNSSGTCPECVSYFNGVAFHNIWWDAEYDRTV